MENLQPGQQLGPYRVIAQVGQGGMATVYKAHQASMDRYVALKVLPREFAHSAQFRERFAQEARLIANLEHAHILPIYDFGEADGVHYFVMRLLETGTLKERIEARPLTLAEIDELFTQLVDALAYAHSRGVVHRDIKPANVLIDQHGDAFLTDFGIAKIVEGSANLTGTGTVTGTPDYMSPEQGRGEKLDQRSDIYALGVVLYEMVTGRVPFQAETPLAVILQHMSAPLPPPSLLKPGTAPEVERVILKALAKEKADRFASCPELLAAWKAAVQAVRIHGQTAPAVAPPTAVGAPASPHLGRAAQTGGAEASNWLPVAVFGLIALCLCGIIAGSAASIPLFAAALNLESAASPTAVEPGVPTIPPIGTLTFPTVPAIPTSPPIPGLTPSAPASHLATLLWSVGEEGQGEGQFNDARYLAVDGDGNIYVGEHREGSRIQIFDHDGDFVKQWPSASDAILTGLAAGPDGTLYAVLAGDVAVYNGETGERLGTFGIREPISAVTVAPDGRVYAVTGSSLVRFSADGEPAVLTDRLRDMIDGALIPEDIEVDEQGNIYVAGNGVFAVLKFTPDAGSLTEIGQQGHDAGQFSSPPTAIAVDSRGVVYADSFFGVEVFDPQGRYLGRIPAAGKVFGLVVQARNDQFELVVLDRNSAKLEKYALAP